MSLIIASGLAVEFGATPVFRDVSFTVGRGERWGIVGRNGTGKTTLFNVIAGTQATTRGSFSRVSDLRLTLLDQHRAFPPGTMAWDAAASAFGDLAALERSLHEQAEAMAHGHPSEEALARYDRDLERFAREGGYEMDARVDAVLLGLGFDPVAARSMPVARLSGGEQGRVGLARQLVAPADLLLLDEPTNHLDLETTRWLEEYLLGLDATVLCISHDRAFLESVADHILHFENGTATPYVGGYSHFVEQRAERRMVQERQYQSQQKLLAKEEDFIRRNIAGQKSTQAKGRRKRIARLPRLSPPPGEEGVMALAFETRQRGGNQVLVAENVSMAVGDRELLQGFSGTLARGEVVGLVGANGTGKSTLLGTVAGERPTQEGAFRLGASIDLAYYRQDMTQVPLGKTLFDIINDLRPRWDRGQVQGHLGRFGFSGEEVQRQADNLSGGERARVALAMLVLSGANFVLLDEPTNHLDVESVEALEEALEGYEGSVLLVSHDRALLRSLVTRVWALEGQTIKDYPGTFEEWEAARAAEREADRQRRLREREEREERDRKASRARAAQEKAGRKENRTLRRAVEEAEAEVHRLEAGLMSLQEALADPALYDGAPAGVQRALELKREIQAAEDALAGAMHRWMEAQEALEG